MKIFFLFGPPGSGKGTQRENIQSEWDSNGKKWLDVQLGDLLRSFVKKDVTPVKEMLKDIINDGRMVPIAFSLLVSVNRLMEIEDGTDYIIVDGGSRSLSEARIFFETLSMFLDLEAHALVLQVSDEEVKKRLLLRAREDDVEDSIQNRIDFYKDDKSGTAAVIKYIEDSGLAKIHKIDGIGSIEEVYGRILPIIK